MSEYYQMGEQEVRSALHSEGGLTSQEAAARQEKYGWNELVEGKKKSVPQIFLEQFADFLVIILIISALVSGILGDWESAIVILVVITMNAILGTVQTVKAEHSLNSLKELSAPMAKVLRDGSVREIPGREVTVGDEILLDAGDFVPADGRLVESASLKVDESALTGESLGVEKETEVISGEVPLGDRKNMVFSGSFVTYGRGRFLVTGIGMETEVGKIAGLLKNASEKKTPLQVNLDQFGKKLSILILVFCGILFGVNVFRGSSIQESFLFAVALAVAAIPEALSSIVTIVLSFGTQKMAREGAIVRKLQAVEGLGSVSVICSDKTGTLTQNKMTVEYYYMDGKRIPADSISLQIPEQRRLTEYSMLCNDSRVNEDGEIGDPTETAMVRLGEQLGLSEDDLRETYPRLYELPFDSDRKRMSTLHQMGEQRVLVSKGAADGLLPLSCKIWKNGELVPMTDVCRNQVLQAVDEFSREGLRVLGVAYRQLQDEEESPSLEQDLCFLGLIAMMDPPRVESAQAVASCKEAGIRPVMITGDHKVTAAAIAKRIGILEDESEACEGAVLDTMDDEQLKEFVEGISVYARVSPEHKIRIVRAWQEKGNVVSMTGDGVNDAPALKQADIGVAMGITGSEVSKDAAAMVLTDDNFATIVKAVENGRNIYANIKRAIQFLLSGNFGAILAVLYASVLALPLPFAPVHLLFINLLTDSLPAIALGLEPHNHEVMRQKPRPAGENILTKSFLLSVGTEGLSIAVTTMIAFYLGLNQGGALLASTMAFGTLCTARLVHGYNCKAERPVIFTRRFFDNWYLQGAFLAGLLMITAVLTVPALHSVFQVQTLELSQLFTVYGLALVNLPIIQLLKKFRTK